MRNGSNDNRIGFSCFSTTQFPISLSLLLTPYFDGRTLASQVPPPLEPRNKKVGKNTKMAACNVMPTGNEDNHGFGWIIMVSYQPTNNV